jgi:DnaJ-class molecular chaperone
LAVATIDGSGVADLYQRLGVNRGATADEITAAFRELARSLHPDSAAAASDPRQLQQVIAAYRVLSDPEQRRVYDSQRYVSSVAVPTSSARCGVCDGTGRLEVPCPACGGTGSLFAREPWLRSLRSCPACGGRKYEPALCGACGATGRQ